MLLWTLDFHFTAVISLTNVSAAREAVNFRLIPRTAAVAITFVDILWDFFN